MIKDIIESLKEKWNTPKHAIHGGEKTILKLLCTFSSIGATKDVIKNIPFDVSRELAEFWSISETATLFKDSEYSQWGLEILSPEEAILLTNEQKSERPDDIQKNDLIIGRFLGDSDLLVISCDKLNDFESLYIGLPIETRKNWPKVATNFHQFLIKYSSSEGEKYWE